MRAASAACSRAVRPSQAIHVHPAPLRHCHLPNDQLSALVPAAAAAPALHYAAVTAGGGRARHLCVAVQARRSREEFERDNDYVAFDDEEDWEQSGTSIQAPGLGPILTTALRGVAAIAEKLTDVALQVAPADASPGVVRVAVNAGLVLMALAFVKSMLSFFLTLGTIILGAYVAVKVFGVDVAGVTSSMSGSGGDSSGGGSGRGSSGRGGSGSGGTARPRSGGKRRPDPRARQSEFKGLLGSGGSKEEDGLLDVWFERKGGSKGSGGGSSRGGSGRQKDTRRR